MTFRFSMQRYATISLVVALIQTLWTITGATSVRIAIPDVAGMLYPEQTYGRVATFANPSMSLQPFYAQQITPADRVPPCDYATLCLDVAWASKYQYDPFVLVAFESKFPVASNTFDNGSNTMTSLVPVIQGNENYATEDLNATRTLWRFYTFDERAQTRTIDLLFRLRQQSQLRAKRDQLLVHVAVQQFDTRTDATSVEVYSVYGNQKTEHKIVFVTTYHIRLNVDILRDPSRADVVLQDAYPLVPVIQTSNERTGQRWHIVDNDCRRCTAQLLGCTSPDDLESGVCAYNTSTAIIPACLRDEKGMSTDWFRILVSKMIGESRLVTDVFWSCLDRVYSRESPTYALPDRNGASWDLTSTLTCLASRQCPFGPMLGVLEQYPNKMVQLTSPVPHIHRVEWPIAEGLSGAFEVIVGGGPNGDAAYQTNPVTIITDQSTEADVASLFVSVFAGLDGVQVQVTKTFTATTAWFDIRVSGLPVYFFINFVSNEQTTVSTTPLNTNGGLTYVQTVGLNTTGLVFESDCDRCLTQLDPCRDDDVCRLQILPCVEQVLASVNVSTASVNTEYGTYRVDILPTLSYCFANASVASWDTIRRGLVCLSKYQCRLDAANSTNVDDATFFILGNGTQLIAVPVDGSQIGSAVVDLVISTPASTFPFHSTVDTLATFLRVFVLGNAADVFVEEQQYAADSTMIQLRITYANTLLLWTPSFVGSNGLVAIDNVLPKASLDYADATAFSVEGMRTVMASLLNTRVNADILGTISNYPWDLAPQCQWCLAGLYGCSQADVVQKSCVYDNAVSHLAQCIRQALPREDIMSLMNASDGQSSRIVTTEITRCIQMATSLVGDKLENRVSMTRALSCFAETQCPFGPLDLVDSDRMVQLTATSYLQSLRVPTRQFQLQLVVSMGKYEIAKVTISDTDTNMFALKNTLLQFGINVQTESSYTESEWTLTIRYNNIIASDFNIQIAPTSVPPVGVIGQAVLRPATRLVVSPRLVYLVHFPSEMTTNPPIASPSPTPTDEVHVLSFTDDCDQCDSVHLAACGRSSYCRNTVASCFSTRLSQYSYTDLAQPMSDGNVSVDLVSILRSCVTNEAFYDWWESIQRWLECYASNSCPITRQDQSRTSDAFLEVSPLLVEITNLWSNAPDGVSFVLSSPGSSMSGRNIIVHSNEDLKADCEHATQGISGVVVSQEQLADDPVTSIAYESHFFGDPLVPVGIAGTVRTTPARLFVRWTSSNFVASSAWLGLVDKLVSMLESPQDTPQSCSLCAMTYLHQCHDIPTCKGYLLQCLSNGIEEHYTNLPITDRSVYQVLADCSRNVSVADWWPVQKYLTCMRNLQCVGMKPNAGPSYIRLYRGQLRLLYSGASWPTTSVSLDGTTRSPTSALELRTKLQSLIGDTGVVETRVLPIGDATQIDVYFYDYVGKLPEVVWGGSGMVSYNPDIVFYSHNSVDSSFISTDMASYMEVLLPFTTECLQCDSVHISACARSSYCRDVVASCFSSYLSQSTYSGLARTMTDGTTSVDLASFVRGCVTDGSFFDWWEPIQRWLGCYASARCPITRQDQDRTNDAYLEFVPANVSFSTFSGLWDDPVGRYFRVSSQGSSLGSKTIVVHSDDELRAALYNSTQGISRGSLSSAWTTKGLTTTLLYEDDYLGELLVPPVSLNVNDQAARAQLLVRWTSPNIPTGDSGWNALVDKISTMSDIRTANTSAPQSCGSCAIAYLRQCHDIPACKTNLLVCFSNSLSTSSVSETDRSVYHVLVACSQNMTVAEWWPVAEYLTCMRDLQCNVNAASAPTYVRLSRGQLRMTGWENQASLTLDVSFEGTTQSPTSVTQLQSVLQSMIGNTGVVEIKERTVGTMTQLDVFFYDYVGKLPEIVCYGASLQTWTPDVVLYSLDYVDPSIIRTDIADYVEVSTLLSFTDECDQCDSVHLPACVRSAYCRSIISTCFTTAMSQNTFADLAQTVLDGTTSVDLVTILRGCLIGTSFYDWWEPIQRWLGCYALARCPISRQDQGRTSDAYLEFIPATLQLNIDANIGSNIPGFLLPQGSTLQNRNVLVQSLDELQEVCEHATQGTSRVNINVGYGADGPETNITYQDPYFGDLPLPMGFGGTVQSTKAQLLVRWTSSNFVSTSAWLGLADKLSSLVGSSQYTPPPSCNACAALYLQQCRDIPECHGYLLECLSSSIDDHYISLPITDRSVYQVLVGCSRNMSVAEWLPVHKYLACMRDLQCTVNDANSGTTYVRLCSGKYRLTSYPNQSITNLMVSFEGTTQSPSTFSQLRTVLQSMIGDAGVVEVTVQALEDGTQVDVVFYNYVGKLPEVTFQGGSIRMWPPDVVFYSLDSIDSSIVTTDLSSYMVVPQCSGICYEYLENCVRGDSYVSLSCRYRTLPCVSDIVMTEVPNGVAGVWSSDRTSVDFSTRIQSCFGYDYTSMYAIAQYFGCLARTGCTLNTPQSTAARAELKFQPGAQVLSLAGPHILQLTSPTGAGDQVSQTYSTDATQLDNFRWGVHTLTMKSLADIVIQEEDVVDGSQLVTITYNNYFGYLPTASGESVTETKHTEPSIGFSSSDRIDSSQWDRLETALHAFTVDKSPACTACVMDKLMNCATCNTVLSSLLVILNDKKTVYNSPTYNLTDVFYACVDTLPVSDWVAVAQVLNCMMINGCPVSSDSGSTRPPSDTATFPVVTPAKITLSIPDTMPQTAVFAYGQAPNHSMNPSTEAPNTAEISIDKDNNYATFKVGLQSMLQTIGQSPKITVTERELEPPTNGQLVLDIQIQDFFGWLPTYQSGSAGSTATAAVNVLPQIIGQTFGNASGASMAGFYDTLTNYVSPPGPSPKVVTGGCIDCLTKLYGCDADTITMGYCSYTTVNARIVLCLRRNIPPSVFYSIGQTLGKTYLLNSVLATCFADTAEVDAQESTSFKTDLSTDMNTGLGCMELHMCPFGPLTEGLAGGNMIQLQSTSATKTYVVNGDAFTAVFRAKFGFRTTESSEFNEATTDGDLWTLLTDILPTSVITVAMAQLPDASGYTITVTYKGIYFPDFVLSVYSSTSSVTDQTGPMTIMTALKTVELDENMITDATG